MFNPLNFTVTIGSLILHERYKRRVENYISLTKELSSESIATKDTVINDDERNSYIQGDRISVAVHDANETARNRVRPTVTSQESQSSSVVPDIEDIVRPTGNDNDNDGALRNGRKFCSSSFACSGPSRQHCQDMVRNYRQQQRSEFLEFYDNIQSLRHTVLLILLLCSMFVVCNFIVFFKIPFDEKCIRIFNFHLNSQSHYPSGRLLWKECLASTLNYHSWMHF